MIDEVDEIVSQVSWTVDDVEIGDMELQNVNESKTKRRTSRAYRSKVWETL